MIRPPLAPLSHPPSGPLSGPDRSRLAVSYAVTGTLSPDATGTLAYIGTADGISFWGTAGSMDSEGEITIPQTGAVVIYQFASAEYQALAYWLDGVQTAQWSGADLSPDSPATGTPTLTPTYAYTP